MFDICVRLCPLFCNRNFSTMVWLQSILNSTLPLTVYVHTNNTTHSYARLFTTRIHCTYVGNTYMIMVVALTCILYNIRTHSHTTTHLPPTRQPTPYPYTQTHTHTHPNTDIQNTTIYTSTPAPWCGVNTILIRYICEFVRVVQVDIFLFIWYTCSLLVILSTHTQQEDSGWHLEYFGCTDPQHTWHFLTQKFVSIKKDIHNFFCCSCFFDH